jgi:hypothetical protein
MIIVNDQTLCNGYNEYLSSENLYFFLDFFSTTFFAHLLFAPFTTCGTLNDIALFTLSKQQSFESTGGSFSGILLKESSASSSNFCNASLNHQEVVLTLNTSMQGMLPFEIDVQHVLSYFLSHLVLYEHINLFLHSLSIYLIYIAMVK